MAETIAKTRLFQKDNPDHPMVNAVLDHLTGRVQIVIVDAPPGGGATEQCPWACRFQSVGNQERQKGK